MTTVTEDILKESDLYVILGVKPDIDVSEINKIYKVLAKKYHPDMINNPSEKDKANQIFAKITSAYNTLKDTEKRKNYDYERKLRQEYEKTLNMTTFSFNNGSGVSININAQKAGTTQTPQKGTPASEETKNEQAEKMYNSALEKYQTGNIDAAILDLQTAVVLAKVAKYHSCLGLFMREKGWNSYAQSHFKTALNIDPKDKLALKYLDSVETNNKEENKKAEIKTNTINKTNSKIKELKKSESKGFISLIKEFFSKIFSKK